MPLAAPLPTRASLLRHAHELAQVRGYNGFSFRDLAERAGITSASIHYHFPTKAHLARDLVLRERQALAAAIGAIEATTDDPAERLCRFIAALRQGLRGGTRMGLSGIFGAEYATLPPDVQAEVRALFRDCETWLESVLTAGRDAGVLAFNDAARLAARVLFDSLQGAMLAACTFRDDSRFVAAAEWILTRFGVDLD